jgi:hypothetical protein
MKNVISLGFRIPQIKVNIWFVLFYICVFTFLVFSILQIQVKCIKLGYEINNYSKKNRYLLTKSQKLMIEKDKYVNNYALYQKAKKLGLVYPHVDRTYYVK